MTLFRMNGHHGIIHNEHYDIIQNEHHGIIQGNYTTYFII